MQVSCIHVYVCVCKLIYLFNLICLSNLIYLSDLICLICACIWNLYMHRIFKLNFVNIFMSKDHYFLHVNCSRVNRHFYIQSYMSRMFFQLVIFCTKLNMPHVFFMICIMPTFKRIICLKKSIYNKHLILGIKFGNTK